MDRIVREAECRQITGLCRTTRWQLERRGLFPARRRLTGNSVGWLESELHEWMRSRESRGGRVPVAALAARAQRPPEAATTTSQRHRSDLHSRARRTAS